jgi:tRNA pseudouridine38-40 synthase
VAPPARRQAADEPADTAGADGLARVRVDLAYDGTAFSGWARQPGRRTVQQILEDALQTVLRLPDPPCLTVAGRTDAGVHARGQVAHVDLPPGAVGRPGDLLRGLSGILPADVRVRSVRAAAPGFDARFSALSRVYAYRVCDDPSGPDPLRRHEVLWYREGRLDQDRLKAASAPLLGLHDFAAYCRARAGGTTVRSLLVLAWHRSDADGLVTATVEADAFCHSMVRALVGALLPVGVGRRDVGWPAQVLAATTREPSVNVLPPHGLTLELVRYPSDAELAARVATTRRPRRGLDPVREQTADRSAVT